MKRIAVILVVLLAGSAYLGAQTKKDAKKPPPKAKPVPVYLGGQVNSGTLPYKTFNELLSKGLNGKDSVGKAYPVTGFSFTYVERNLYEDSVGKLMVVPDYLMEYCFGDTLSSFLLNNISERSKPGDTVYIDRITLKAPDGNGTEGKSIKLVLTK